MLMMQRRNTTICHRHCDCPNIQKWKHLFLPSKYSLPLSTSAVTVCCFLLIQVYFSFYHASSRSSKAPTMSRKSWWEKKKGWRADRIETKWGNVLKEIQETETLETNPPCRGGWNHRPELVGLRSPQTLTMKSFLLLILSLMAGKKSQKYQYSLDIKGWCHYLKTIIRVGFARFFVSIVTPLLFE